MNKIDYKTLFGSEGNCQCAHCRSVYSPAAYFVDVLLHAIPDEARRVLLDPNRRADLGRIELSCANTETPLPYVDLVNELLEDYVSPRSFSTLSVYKAELDNHKLEAALRQEFAIRGMPLSAAALVAVVDPGKKWTVTDTGWNHSLQEEAGQLKIFPVPQTGGTTADLSANPEHVNDEAYQKLSQGVYPWDLPFDLPVEEARKFLEHLGVSRLELMRKFQRQDAATKLLE